MGLFRPYERQSDKPGEGTGGKTGQKVGEPKPSTKPERKAGAGADSANASTPIAPPPTTQAEPAPRVPQKKDAPTKSRRQAEAERMERLHPTLTPKQQKKADRAARDAARMEALDRAEQSPERVLLRDFLDSRWTINEFVLPGMILIMAITMATINNVLMSSYVAMGLWALMIMAIINSWFMWRSFKKILAERVPHANTRGLAMYMFNRSIMLRRFRRPAPRIARGEFR